MHRGAGFASLVSTEAYTRAREIVRGFVGAREDDLVLFTRNTTDALNLLASALPAGTTVLTFTGEHHANLLPWRRGDVRHLAIPASPADALEALEAELRALGGAPRARRGDGRLERDGRGVADRGDRRGSRIATVRGSRWTPRSWRRTVRSTSPPGTSTTSPSPATRSTPRTAPACSPGRADWLDAARPYLAGGGAVRRVTADDVEWATGPARHEGGTPAALGAVAIAAAVSALSETGWERIQAHEQELLERLLAGLDAIGGVRTYELWERGRATASAS